MKSERRKAKYCLIAIGAVLLTLLAQPALANTVTWTGPSGNWTTASSWSSSPNLPAAGDDVFLTSATSKTVTLNTKAPATGSFDLVWIGASSGTFTVNQSSSTTSLSAGGEVIGFSPYVKGAYNQSGGSNTITNALVLGIGGPGSSGTYNMTGGTFSAGAIIVGPYGTGTFSQSSKTVNIGSYLWDGTEPYSLVVGGEYNGGTSFSGTGTYTNSSGTLNIAGGAVIGQTGNGTFTQSSGKTSIGGDLVVGNHAGATGKFTMSSGTLNVTGNEIIGNGDGSGGATGTFTQSSGTQTIGGNLDVGSDTGSTGTFTMSSGSLKVGGTEYIGNSGNGTFTQSSGSNTIGQTLVLANAAGTTGTFTMSSGSLSVGSTEYIGATGDGTFTQSSGSNTAGGDFYLAYGPNSGGSSYTMSSGSLLVKGANGEFIGNNAPATFTQSSGSNTVTSATGKILIAPNAGTNYAVTYNLNGGSVNVPNNTALDAIHVFGPYTPTSVTNPVSTTGGNFLIKGTSTVNGNVTNDGLVNTTNANVTWNGTFTDNSAYVSGTNTPSSTTTQTFNKDMVVNSTGYIVANSPLTGITPQDLYIFRGNFLNQSTQSASWNTANAEIEFSTGASTTHTLNINADGTAAGHPFAWATMWIDSNQTLKLTGGAGDALWVNGLVGVKATSFTSGATLTNIFNDSSSALDIYYSMDAPFSGLNGYLGNYTYIIPADPSVIGAVNGELIAHAPLPPSVLLLGSGLLGMGLLGYRRKRLMG